MTAERPLPEGFRPLTLEDRDVLAPFLLASGRQSCEFAFANLFLWSGRNPSGRGRSAVMARSSRV